MIIITTCQDEDEEILELFDSKRVTFMENNICIVTKRNPKPDYMR